MGGGEMINHNSKWIKQILDLQHEDGSWGCFHTLSNPTKAQPMTTEQALRRLRVLGLTKDDEPIKRAIAYMEWCLAQPVSPVFQEKLHNAEIFSDLILAANIMRFDRANNAALPVAYKWLNIIEAAFADGAYNHARYIEAYEETFQSKLNPKAGRLADFVCFYQLVVLCGGLTERAELPMLDYAITHPTGIYYVYNKPLNEQPEVFASKETSWWLAAVELLSFYRSAHVKFGFVVDYLIHNQLSPGVWDLGQQAKDGIYFPISDSWRKAEDRQRDCTTRIQKLLDKLTLKVPFLTYDELVDACNIKVRDKNHERVIKMFYSYSRRVSGKSGLWAEVMSKVLGLDFSGVALTTGCFNGVNDGIEPPYGNPDCYIKMSNDTRVYIYGAVAEGELKQLKDNEYVIFALSDTVTDNIERHSDRHIFIR
jgi:hypothetical protein